MAWLEQAEIVASQPDVNAKPDTYFIVTPMTSDNFRAWSAAGRLTVSEVPKVPSNVWILPATVKPGRWIDNTSAQGVVIDAHATSQAAVVWSRWTDGFAYTVVYPRYE